MRHWLIPIALLGAGPASARKADLPAPVCTGTIRPVLFLSPMGEPFRAAKGAVDTPGDAVRRWFDGADRDHDGRLRIAEFMLDADRFFALLDKDHDGQILPEEVSSYEEDVAPEMRLYQPPRPAGGPGGKPDRKAKRPKGGADYDGAMGAGRYAFLNIPNPVASADSDFNRAIDPAEFRAAAAERFRALDPGQKKQIALADLPPTPAQGLANADCLAEQAAAARGKR